MSRRKFNISGTETGARRLTSSGLPSVTSSANNRPKTTTGFIYPNRVNTNQSSSSSYPPWEHASTGEAFTPRRPYTGPQIPQNFHEYHFRSAFLGDSGGPSNVSTAATDMSKMSSQRTFSTSSAQNAEFGVADGTNFIARNWEHTGLGSILNTKQNDPTIMGGGIRFTIMSYNILAPGLLEKHPELYRKCERVNLDWDFRIMRIFLQVENFAPDVVCLQEVEMSQYIRIIEPRFNHLGFRGVFKKKSGDKDDGCAIFYRTSRFLLIDKLEVELFQPHVPLLNRDNIGLLVKLETRNVTKRQKLVVGTTHLLFNQRRQVGKSNIKLDVRIAQVQLLLAELDRFAFSGIDRDGVSQYYPVLFTGDFNSKPYSSVTKLISEGRLQYLDENGDLVNLLKRKGINSLLPRRSGISDQCQHYKVILERFKKWKTLRTNNFELDLKLQESLVNLYPYLEARGIHLNPTGSSPCIYSPPAPDDDVDILLSPTTELYDAPSSIGESNGPESKLLATAADKIALQIFNHNKNILVPANSAAPSRELLYFPIEQNHVRLEMDVVEEINKCGLSCDFDSGTLSHNFNFRDIYSGRLDRQGKDNEVGITASGSGWTCVDYIFQSMNWHNQFNKMVEGKLKLVRRLGLYTRSECKQMGDIPSEQHPSDHFPLVAEFLLRP